MSKKRKGNQTELKVKSVEVVPYRVFFHDCLHKGLVDSWQEREIHVFFRDLGLTDKESPETYKDALAKF